MTGNSPPQPPPGPGPGLSPRDVEALLLDTTPWLSCDDCFDRMDSYVEALERDRHHHDPAMEAHLRGCPACAEEVDGLVDLVTDPRRGSREAGP
jgi:hypothetical protein